MLLSYGCSALEFFSNVKSIDYDVQVDTSDTSQMLTEMHERLLKWNTVHEFLDIAYEFSPFRLSPQIQFDAITFELETKGSVGLEFDSRDYCNEHACITNQPMLFPPDSVGLLHWCEKEANGTDGFVSRFGHSNCTITSKSSVLIYSLAHHIEADEAYIQHTANGPM